MALNLQISETVSDTERLNYVHKQFDIDLDINEIDYQYMMDSYHDYDQRLKKYNMLGYSSMWQILLDKDGYPATKPPWGFISKISLAQGQVDWKIHFGSRENISGLTVAKGDKNFEASYQQKQKLFLLLERLQILFMLLIQIQVKKSGNIKYHFQVLLPQHLFYIKAVK